MMRKNFYLYDRFFESDQNFSIKHQKIFEIPGFSRFFSDFCSKFQVFPGFFQNL